MTNTTVFKSISRARGRTAVLLPGWATDHRIFRERSFDADLILPRGINTADFFEKLKREVGSKKVFLIGWSFGGVLAGHFLAKYPDNVRKAVLIGVKSSYSVEDVDQMKKYLAVDKTKYLRVFYKLCTKGTISGKPGVFAPPLTESFIQSFDAKTLSQQLDFLRDNPLPLEILSRHSKKILFIHGSNDVIAGTDDFEGLKKYFPDSCLKFLNDAGHAAFLHPAFPSILRTVW